MVGRLGRGRHFIFHVGEAKAPGPDELPVLDYAGGHAGDVQVSPVRVQFGRETLQRLPFGLGQILGPERRVGGGRAFLYRSRSRLQLGRAGRDQEGCGQEARS